MEEVPSAIKPIAGVSTSTAGFIGVMGDSIDQPLAKLTGAAIGTGDGTKTAFELPVYPVGKAHTAVKVDGTAATGVTIANDDVNKVSTATFGTAPTNGSKITADIVPSLTPVPAGMPKLCTTFSDFKKFFGDFNGDTQHDYLAHAVYAFFNNGGSRCYVMRVASEADIPKFLLNYEAIDEVAIVAAPGLAQNDATGKNTRTQIIAHCQVRTQNRFAIFDSPTTVESGSPAALDLTLLDAKNANSVLPPFTDFAAFYFPWLEVFDPITKGPIYVPPSGHVAGIYARVDNDRGVHKAPANEPVIGATGLKYAISKAQQDGLNPEGVNCIRNLNGNLTVWGARTLGGDANADLKYINVRRTLLFLRKSIEEGTQWVVFEPNEPGLWQKITRNITAFLTNVWRSGALFGTTVQEAFYVKCDAETNPPELRDVGQVVAEIGVAIVRPAEFVIFRISQFTAPSK
ncbi:MAG TPA: phage tail sheath C-terminal domain-containing protein [Acetobacteraceae bacterium]|nr:phage tail sheath C-terminal domain-containing protein [Acetobacteraceae bacterium]